MPASCGPHVSLFRKNFLSVVDNMKCSSKAFRPLNGSSVGQGEPSDINLIYSWTFIDSIAFTLYLVLAVNTFREYIEFFWFSIDQIREIRLFSWVQKFGWIKLRKRFFAFKETLSSLPSFTALLLSRGSTETRRSYFLWNFMNGKNNSSRFTCYLVFTILHKSFLEQPNRNFVVNSFPRGGFLVF